MCIFLATTMRPMDKVTYGIVITCRALCSFKHDQVDVQKHTFSLKQVEKAQPNSQRNVKSSLTHLLCKQDGTTKVKNLDCHQLNAHHLKFIDTEIKYISIWILLWRQTTYLIEWNPENRFRNNIFEQLCFCHNAPSILKKPEIFC